MERAASLRRWAEVGGAARRRRRRAARRGGGAVVERRRGAGWRGAVARRGGGAEARRGGGAARRRRGGGGAEAAAEPPGWSGAAAAWSGGGACFSGTPVGAVLSEDDAARRLKSVAMDGIGVRTRLLHAPLAESARARAGSEVEIPCCDWPGPLNCHLAPPRLVFRTKESAIHHSATERGSDSLTVGHRATREWRPATRAMPRRRRRQRCPRSLRPRLCDHEAARSRAESGRRASPGP